MRQVRAGLGCRSTSGEAQAPEEQGGDGDGTEPVPGASTGLTHRVAVQQEDTVGTAVVLHSQVERVGAVEVGLGLEQSTVPVRLHQRSQRSTRLPLASSQKTLGCKPWVCSPKHCLSWPSSALSKSPGLQLQSLAEPQQDKAWPMGLPRAQLSWTPFPSQGQDVRGHGATPASRAERSPCPSALLHTTGAMS